jgi:hypothetical protein
MTLEPFHGPGVVEASTLEVRWILPGAVPAATVDWFGRLSQRTESRDDTYLLNPRLDNLSVKIRGTARFEVKLRGDSPGVLDIPGRATGRIESWRKWSFPLGSGDPRADETADWRRVGKIRTISWFSPTGRPRLVPPAGIRPDGCALELTALTIDDHAWWTLGFEATGPRRRRLSAIEAAAATVFVEPMPEGVPLYITDSQSYSAWLRHPRNAGSPFHPESPNREPHQALP